MSAATSELQTLYQLLELIEQKMQSINAAAGATDIVEAQRNMNEMRITLTETMMLVNRLFFILRRAGLPDDVVAAITLMQRMITTAYSLTVAINALMISTGGTAHLVLAGLGVVTSILAMGSVVGSYG